MKLVMVCYFRNHNVILLSLFLLPLLLLFLLPFLLLFCFLLDTYGILLELQIANCTLLYREVYDCNVVKSFELNEV